MANPTIVATGGTSGANAAGVSSQTYVVGETITFSDPANPGATTHLWQLIDAPPEQTSPLVNATTATPTLLIDAGVEGGTYRVRYTADGTEIGELLFAVQTTSVDVLNQRIPGYLEQDNLRAAATSATEGTWNENSNTKGWFPDLYSLLKTIIAAFAGAFRKTVAGEVNALTDKATPVAADVILIEDSEDSFNKKKASLTTLIGGGGGGTEVTAAGSFVRASLGTTQVNPALNAAVVWDTQHASDGSNRIQYNTGNGQVTVKAGVTAFLHGQLHLEHSASFLQEWGWWDVTANVEVLGSRQENRSTTATAQRSSTTISSAVVRPAVDTVYELRLLNNATVNVDIRNVGTWLQAFEIGASTNAGEGDYLIASLSAIQTSNLNVNDHIEFDSFARRGTSISLATGAGQANGLFTLEGGKTYEIQAHVGTEINEGRARIGWHDDPGDTNLNDDTGQTVGVMFFRDNAANDNAVNPSQTIVYTPAVTTTIKLMVTEDVNLVQIEQSTRVFIREIAAQSGTVASVVLGTDSTQMDITGLDGDADGVYDIDMQLLLAGGAGNLQMQPNLTITGTRSGLANGNSSESEVSDWRLATYSGISAPMEYHLKMRLWASRTLNGETRSVQYVFEGIRFDDTDSFSNVMHGGGFVKALAANLTGLRLVNTVANGILQGSQVTVRRVR